MLPSPEFLDRIVLGDCQDLLAALPSGSVDLVLSSPPYNLGKEYEARVALDRYVAQMGTILAECARVLKPTGSIFWQVGAYSEKGTLIPLDVRFFPVLESLGLQPRNRIVWIRQHGLHARRKFSARHETLLWFTKTDDYFFHLDAVRVPQKYQGKTFHKGRRYGELSCNPMGKNPGDLWSFRNVKHNHEEQTIHPCQFPEDLVARIVLATTEEGGVILDPFMGTGTCAVVARDLGRRFVGAEVDATYQEVAMRRLSGEPDENRSFANLKCLRAWVHRTGEPIERFRFDVQTSRRPSSTSKVNSEEHHLTELETRLELEETAFGQRVVHGQIDPSLLARIATTTSSSARDGAEGLPQSSRSPAAADKLFP
ncbi:MAG TPA: site-specific DNA-methyltransferase [Solirubrobacteraceae bacterium]|jgi:adenine-specific DNA-methyltransferase|nr:site-specific DNA-methyltransferase [Solirubrobacteraceae bacterium]